MATKAQPLRLGLQLVASHYFGMLIINFGLTIILPTYDIP